MMTVQRFVVMALTLVNSSAMMATQFLVTGAARNAKSSSDSFAMEIQLLPKILV